MGMTHTVIRGARAALRSGDWLDRSRLLGYAVILGTFELALLLFWGFGAHDNLDPTGKPLGTDFLSYWSASALALMHTPALVYDPAAHATVEASQVGGADVGYFGFFYPPVFLLFCLPLATLPYGLALGAWLLATGVPYLVMLRRLLPKLDGLAFVAALAFPALIVNIGHGQNGFLSAALFGFGFLLLERRPILAGVLLGALVFKPQLAVLIPFALGLSGRWRAFIAAAASAALLTGLSWAAFGTATWAGFFNGLTLAQETLSAGFVEPAKMVSLYAAARLLHAPPEAALALQVVAAIAAVALLAKTARQMDTLMLAALTVTATLLATPFALDYDLTLLAIPLAVLLGRGLETGFLPYEKVTLALGFALPLAARPIALGLGLPLAPIVLILLLAVTLRRVRAGDYPNTLAPRSAVPTRERKPAKSSRPMP
jgi:hypothetical protein